MNNPELSPVEIRESGIHGTGAFANRDIRTGEIIIEYLGQIIDRAEAIRRDDPSSPDYSEYILEVDENRYIDGKVMGSLARYVNHSCNYNCDIERIDGRAFITASRDIRCGEELTYDYDFGEESEAPCSCGSASCRGYI